MRRLVPAILVLMMALGAIVTVASAASAQTQGQGLKCGHYPPDPRCPPQSRGNRPGPPPPPHPNSSVITDMAGTAIPLGMILLGGGVIALVVIRHRRTRALPV
jgi:hypothetical protein